MLSPSPVLKHSEFFRMPFSGWPNMYSELVIQMFHKPAKRSCCKCSRLHQIHNSLRLSDSWWWVGAIHSMWMYKILIVWFIKQRIPNSNFEFSLSLSLVYRELLNRIYSFSQDFSNERVKKPPSITNQSRQRGTISLLKSILCFFVLALYFKRSAFAIVGLVEQRSFLHCYRENLVSLGW